MMRLPASPLTLAIMLAAASPAAAQVAGVYSGMTENGNAVSFTVAANPATGNMAVVSGSIGISTPCAGGGPTLNEGEGYGLEADIVNGRVTATASYPSFYSAFSLAFYKNNKDAKGVITTVAPDLDASNGQPHRTYTCTSPRQSFTLTLQAPDSSRRVAAAVPSGQTYVYDRRGRIIGSTSR